MIGAGPAGLQAAIQSARKKASTVVLGRSSGSALAGTRVENYFAGGESGAEMLGRGRAQAEAAGAVLLEENVVSAAPAEDGFVLGVESGGEVRCRAVVIATGISRVKLGIPGEKELFGKGVSYCAVCDCNFYKGRRVAVVGNDSEAAVSAELMTRYASETHWVCWDLKVGGRLGEGQGRGGRGARLQARRRGRGREGGDVDPRGRGGPRRGRGLHRARGEVRRGHSPGPGRDAGGRRHLEGGRLVLRRGPRGLRLRGRDRQAVAGGQGRRRGVRGGDVRRGPCEGVEMTVSDLISGMLREEGGFQKAFRSILEDELDMSLNEFCQLSGVSQSTMYKILEDKREPNLRTVRQVVKSLKIIMGPEDSRFIAVVANNMTLENLPKAVDMDGLTVGVREYPVSTVEDAIIAAVRAERDGALGVVCAPIVAPTIEKILSIPVSRAVPSNSVVKAVDRLKDLIRAGSPRKSLIRS